MTQKATVAALLDRHGRTYADELGIDLAPGTPSPLFRWLSASMLYSARISADIATRTARAMADAGWTTAQHLADSTWAERVRVINRAGYARYDERTSRMLGELADTLLERWGGDLRRLREEAEHDPARERALLKELKGIGDVGVDIFFREVQITWDELRPFADRKALGAARALGLGDDATALGRLADREADGDVARLVAALVRCALAKDADELRA
ncbi:hypothetical protein ACVU7I_04650 [Patulibacter sp. S7RM1-6]